MSSINPQDEANKELNDSGYVQDETPKPELPGEVEEYRGTAGLLDLSDDVLLIILRTCSPQDLKALGFTCPRFGALVLDRSLWSEVDAGASPLGRRRVRWLLQRALGPHTRKLRLRGYADQTEGCLGYMNNYTLPDSSDENAASITSLGAEERYLCGGPRIYRLTQTLPSVVRYGGSPESAPSECPGPQLTLTHTALRELALRCTALRTLELDYCVIDCRTTNIGMFPKSLKKLSLKGTKCFNLESRSFLFKIQDHLLELEELDVSYCEWIEPACMLPLSKVPRLRRLSMRECYKLAEFVAYASLATRYGFKELQHLDLRGSPVGDSEVSALGWLPALAALLLAPAPDAPRARDHAHFSQDPLPPYNELEEWEETEPEYFRAPSISEADWIRDEEDVRGNRSMYYSNCDDPTACILLERMVAEPVSPGEYSQVYHQFLSGHNSNVQLANPQQYRESFRRFMLRPTHGHPPAGYSLFIRRPDDDSLAEPGPSGPSRLSGTSTEDNPQPGTSGSSGASGPAVVCACGPLRLAQPLASAGPSSSAAPSASVGPSVSAGPSGSGEASGSEGSKESDQPMEVDKQSDTQSGKAETSKGSLEPESGARKRNAGAAAAGPPAKRAAPAAEAPAPRPRGELSDEQRFREYYESMRHPRRVFEITINEVNRRRERRALGADPAGDDEQGDDSSQEEDSSDEDDSSEEPAADSDSSDESEEPDPEPPVRAKKAKLAAGKERAKKAGKSAAVAKKPTAVDKEPAADKRLTGSKKPAADKKAMEDKGDKEPAEDKEPAGDKKPASNKKGAKDKRPASDKQPAEEKRSTGEKKSAGDKKPASDKGPARDERPASDKEPAGDTKPDKDPAEDKKPEKRLASDKEPAGDKKSDNSPASDQEPAGDNKPDKSPASDNEPAGDKKPVKRPASDKEPSIYKNPASDKEPAGENGSADDNRPTDAAAGRMASPQLAGARPWWRPNPWPVYQAQRVMPAHEDPAAVLAEGEAPRVYQFRQYRRPIVIEEYINVADPEAPGALPRGVLFPGSPTRLDHSALVSDSSIRRFGRALGENINYIQIGAAAADGNARPDTSSLRLLSVTGFRHVTDASLVHLATAAPLLQRVDFTNTSVTPAGVRRFCEMRPDVEVVFSEFVG